MSMKLTNIHERTCRFCAFCKYWYDPTNSAIEPVGGSSGFWRFDMSKEALCMKTVRMKRNPGRAAASTNARFLTEEGTWDYLIY